MEARVLAELVGVAPLVAVTVRATHPTVPCVSEGWVRRGYQ
jgi:hypothetical protein